jgi:hypothetical protein
MNGAYNLVDSLSSRPGMYVNPVNFSTVVAFIDGYDAGTGNYLLFGFREWLQIKLGKRSSFAWPNLILEREGLLSSRVKMDDEEAQEKLLNLAFADLREFLKIRSDAAQLASVFSEYAALGLRRRPKAPVRKQR